ncbi:hypothetical protein [Polaromonas sp. CG9_12]|nr:hypothetical protein [Polaromonas sp. CG9_12]
MVQYIHRSTPLRRSSTQLEKEVNIQRAALAAPGPQPASLNTQWRSTVEVVAQFKAQAQTMTLCPDSECCNFGLTRTGSCACAQDPDALAASSLHAAALYAERAHRAHERRALNLQMNDKTGFCS